jgi:hypothetical protein
MSRRNQSSIKVEGLEVVDYEESLAEDKCKHGDQRETVFLEDGVNKLLAGYTEGSIHERVSSLDQSIDN